MARRHHAQKTITNFDGLTDAVTNLVGTLILLVVLILGITTQGQPRNRPDDSPTQETETLSIEPLVRRIEMIRLEIRQVDSQTRQIEQALPGLEERIRQLRSASDPDGTGDLKVAKSRPPGIPDRLQPQEPSPKAKMDVSG